MTTPFIKLSKNVFLKMENMSKTLSHKERLAHKHIINAYNMRYKNITVGSCGNYGFSILQLANKYGINAKIFIPKSFVNDKITYLKKYQSDNIESVDYSYEDAVRASIKYALKKNSYYDANCFSIHSSMSYASYYNLSREIVEEFKSCVHSLCIWIPVGNGITLTSIYRYFSQNNINIRYGIVGSKNNSSPIQSMKNKYPTRLNQYDIEPSEYNEPLVNYEIVPNTLELIDISKNNFISEITDKNIQEAYKILTTIGIQNIQPYGCSALAGFLQHDKNINTKYTNIILITA